MSIRAVPVVDAAGYAAYRRQAIFGCRKWDPQVGDVATVSDLALVIAGSAWERLARTAEALAAEALAAEDELLDRPDLYADLGLPRALRNAFAGAGGRPPAIVRVQRFDFHPVAEGFALSEVNSDVPGGFNEAGPFAALAAARMPGTRPLGDPLAALAAGIAARAGDGVVALVHCTSYSDDRQVMEGIAQALARHGRTVIPAAPDHLRWSAGGCRLRLPGAGPIAAVVRFFPGEWLPGLPRSSGWRAWFGPTAPPAANPLSALLIQGKRFPLVWDRLRTPLPAWRAVLPETRCPRSAPPPGDPEWVHKPAWGRVGEGVLLTGVTSERELRRIARSVRWSPRSWVAQRRFASLGLDTPGGVVHACIGVFVVDGRAAGAYGRVADRPLIDGSARDAAVLVEEPAHA